jgi:hypothetical protein
LVAVACEKPSPDPSTCQIADDSCYDLLLREAAAGNWRAAARLGYFRAMTSGWRSREILEWVRLWYAHDPAEAAITLSAMLADSCDRKDREEALQIYEKYVVPTRPPGNRGVAEMRDRLAANVADGVSKCVDYRK